jgi:hypothetical protein
MTDPSDEEFDDEPMLSDEELKELEAPLFQAIRDAHQFDVELDEDIRRLMSGDYGESGPTEDPA